ncbi:hypothetical protein JQC92_02970 [Shewanella sp. 202IG2-18]|nr:hypothetical protein [Parashewanella hymeniacidonis]MBM7071003.1 hypothetical protein [Parashewanella hymeniacidonis]
MKDTDFILKQNDVIKTLIVAGGGNYETDKVSGEFLIVSVIEYFSCSPT